MRDPVRSSRREYACWTTPLAVPLEAETLSASIVRASDLRWDDLDLPKRTIAVRRLKGSTDSVHYLERDELAGLKRLNREQDAKGRLCVRE
jgi:hypothetical protein